MNPPSQAGFDHASACAPKMLTPLRSEELANQMRKRLRNAGLRPTRPRVALAFMLFAQGNRHVSAEMLFEEASQAKVSVSLATIYNTLHEFTKVGFLRQVAIDSSKSYFDTNNTEHHHYYLEDRHELMDIPPADVAVGKVPVPPAGYEIVWHWRGSAFAAQNYQLCADELREWKAAPAALSLLVARLDDACLIAEFVGVPLLTIILMCGIIGSFVDREVVPHRFMRWQ